MSSRRSASSSSSPYQDHHLPLRRSRRLSDKTNSVASSRPTEFSCTELPVISSPSPTVSESQKRSRASAKKTPDSGGVAASGSSRGRGRERGRGRGRGRGPGRGRDFNDMPLGEAHIIPPASKDNSKDLSLEQEPVFDIPAAKRRRSLDSRIPETSAAADDYDTGICSTSLEQEMQRETESEVQISTEDGSIVHVGGSKGRENVEVPLSHHMTTGPSVPTNYEEEMNAELSSGGNQAQAIEDNIIDEIEKTDANMASDQEQPAIGPPDRAGEEETLDGNARMERRRIRAESSRSRFLQIARQRAFHFAHFDANADEPPAGAPPVNGRRRGIHQIPPPEHQQQQADWPGPFSTARQLVQNRALATAARKNMTKPEAKASLVDWHPRVSSEIPLLFKRPCPSLLDLCVGILANNAEDVVSLEGVPESIRARISTAFCERRKMNAKALSLFFQGSPSEIYVPDCSQVKETELMEIMGQLSTERLEELHLGLCGRALSENCLLSTIFRSPNAYKLKSISLHGAYRLADRGLELLLQSSPLLAHLDLSACSFLTDVAMKSVVNHSCSTLESLILDNCCNLNAKTIIYDLVKLQKLQKLSLSAVTDVTDEVVSELSVRLGGQLRELSLSYCSSLTDAAIAGIGACCSSLKVLNLAHLTNLSDISIAHITDGLREIQELDARRCKFSDEGIAAYITASGGSLVNLSVNSVQQAGEQTVLALAKHTNTHLQTLDMSFCRSVSDESLGFLADSCPHLSVLRLYGCTQITEKFLKGHRNSNLMVLGL